MKTALGALVLGLFGFIGLAKAGVLGGPPKGSEPTEFPQLKGKGPQHTSATAVSGRQYEVWTWPEVPGIGIYAVVKARGTDAWMSFTNNTSVGSRTPAKTNVSEVVKDPSAASALLALMRADWML